jgi:hypothetical protein
MIPSLRPWRRAPFLFLFAGREVRLPSRRRALLAWGSGDCFDLFFLGLLLFPIASLLASGDVNLLWSINRLSPPGGYGMVIAREQRLFGQKKTQSPNTNFRDRNQCRRAGRPRGTKYGLA